MPLESGTEKLRKRRSAETSTIISKYIVGLNCEHSFTVLKGTELLSEPKCIPDLERNFETGQTDPCAAGAIFHSTGSGWDLFSSIII